MNLAETLLDRFFRAIPGSCRSRGIYRRGTAPISRLVWRTLRDDNGQIYETAYRSSGKSNFRGRRSRTASSVSLARCVASFLPPREREVNRRKKFRDVRVATNWNLHYPAIGIKKQGSLTINEKGKTRFKGATVSIVSLDVSTNWNIDFCFGRQAAG